MKDNAKKSLATRWIIFVSMIITLLLLLTQLCIVSVNENVSAIENIRYTTRSRKTDLLNFSNQIEYVDNKEIRCKYNDVSYIICVKEGVNTIYASMASSYLRDESIQYVVEENNIKEIGVDDGTSSAVRKLIGILIIEFILIIVITFFCAYLLK